MRLPLMYAAALSVVVAAGCITITFCNESEEPVTFQVGIGGDSFEVPAGECVSFQFFRSEFYEVFAIIDSSIVGACLLGADPVQAGVLPTVTWDGNTITCDPEE